MAKKEKKKNSFLDPKILINVLISLVIMFCLFKFANINVKNLITQIKSTNLIWFSLTVLTCVIQVYTNSMRWHILTNLLNYKIKYLRSVHWYFQAAFSNNFLPSNIGGDALRAYYLGKEHKDWLRAASTVLVERLTGFFIMICAIPLGLAFMKLSPTVNSMPSKLYWGLLGIFVITIVMALSYKIWTMIPLKFIEKIKFAIEEYTQCHKSLSRVLIWTVITHGFLVFTNIFAAKSLGVAVNEIPFWYWLLITPTATLASFVIPAVKGIGAKEASYVYFLSMIGVKPDLGLSIAFIVFAATLVASLPGITVIFQRK